MGVPVQLERPPVRLLPDRQGVVTEDETLLANPQFVEVIGVVKKVPNFVGIVVITPDDVDILAIDAVPIEFASLVINIMLGERKITQNPKSVVLADHLIDSIRKVIIHDVAGVT